MKIKPTLIIVSSLLALGVLANRLGINDPTQAQITKIAKACPDLNWNNDNSSLKVKSLLNCLILNHEGRLADTWFVASDNADRITENEEAIDEIEVFSEVVSDHVASLFRPCNHYGGSSGAVGFRLYMSFLDPMPDDTDTGTYACQLVFQDKHLVTDTVTVELPGGIPRDVAVSSCAGFHRNAEPGGTPAQPVIPVADTATPPVVNALEWDPQDYFGGCSAAYLFDVEAPSGDVARVFISGTLEHGKFFGTGYTTPSNVWDPTWGSVNGVVLKDWPPAPLILP